MASLNRRLLSLILITLLKSTIWREVKKKTKRIVLVGGLRLAIASLCYLNDTVCIYIAQTAPLLYISLPSIFFQTPFLCKANVPGIATWISKTPRVVLIASNTILPARLLQIYRVGNPKPLESELPTRYHAHPLPLVTGRIQSLFSYLIKYSIAFSMKPGYSTRYLRVDPN